MIIKDGVVTLTIEEFSELQNAQFESGIKVGKREIAKDNEVKKLKRLIKSKDKFMYWNVKHCLEVEMGLLYICPNCNAKELVAKNFCRDCGMRLKLK